MFHGLIPGVGGLTIRDIDLGKHGQSFWSLSIQRAPNAPGLEMHFVRKIGTGYPTYQGQLRLNPNGHIYLNQQSNVISQALLLGLLKSVNGSL